MIKNILIILGSIVLTLGVSYLATFGHEIKLIAGFFVFTIYTYIIISGSNKEVALKRFLLIILPVIFILSPLYFIDFENTKLSLPSSLALALGCVAGYLLVKRNMRFVSVILTTAVLFMFFKGHSIWVHKMIFGNYNAKVKEPLGEFTLYDIGGESIQKTDWNSKTVILNFWNIHCKPCIEEFPDFKQLLDKHSSENRLFFGVNIPIRRADTKDEALNIITKYKGNFPNLFSRYLDNTVKVFGVSVYPTLIIIENNKIILRGTLDDCKKYFALH